MQRARSIKHLVAAAITAATLASAGCVPQSTPPMTGTFNPVPLPGLAVPLPLNGCTDHNATVTLQLAQVGVTQPLTEVYEWGTWTLTDGSTPVGNGLLAYHGTTSQPGGQALGTIPAGHCFTLTLSGYYYVLGYTVTW